MKGLKRAANKLLGKGLDTMLLSNMCAIWENVIYFVQSNARAFYL